MSEISPVVTVVRPLAVFPTEGLLDFRTNPLFDHIFFQGFSWLKLSTIYDYMETVWGDYIVSYLVVIRHIRKEVLRRDPAVVARAICFATKT